MVQVTAHKDQVPPDVVKKVSHLDEHSFVAVRGRVRSIEKAPHGAEIIPNELRILGSSEKRVPFSMHAKKLPRIDRRLDFRSLDLRRPQVQAIFKIRHTALAAIREFLAVRGYLEVNTPKIIASATEGGAALFPLLYYDKEAFLAQSPQLYKEQLTSAFEKVFEISSVFRAEQFRTLRHLSEILSVDVEEACVSYEDIMSLLEELIAHVIEVVGRRNPDELETLGVKADIPARPFRRVRYDEALETLRKKGVRVEWGEDFSTPTMQKLGGAFTGFYYITDWPSAAKPFYIKPSPANPSICEAFDLMYGSLEIASGGTRVSSKKLLAQRLKEKGLKPKSFEYHLKAYEFGMPPHAGFGLGLERLLMVITGQQNIREVVLYPRDPGRLTP